ncbi:hypothetical protein SAMN05421736_101555 [Evansella caseinilytica]|uniref:Uncharacterized protein n=1 Tax=Evansella caseinilytica TaxID=1503961 RepID=A0A1H3HN41_9BACI|nr:hypothetical protein [Evansella caseinilytica]SDY16923.1 hypothetical protein SAMN05421736_101555 [Evansella caseinilytica]
MAVVDTALVTIVLDALIVAGVEAPIGATLIVDAPFPIVNGTVVIDLEPILGVEETLIVPVPSVDFAADVALSPLVTASLLITATPAP